MEKFLLGGGFARDKLDIVHQQHIRLTVFGAEFRRGAGADGLDQLVGDIFALGIDDFHRRRAALDLVANSIQQMGFPQSGGAIDKQGIIISSGLAGYSLGGRMGEFVGGAHDKVFKGIFIVGAFLSEQVAGLRLLYRYGGAGGGGGGG